MEFGSFGDAPSTLMTCRTQHARSSFFSSCHCETRLRTFPCSWALRQKTQTSPSCKYTSGNLSRVQSLIIKEISLILGF
ncbi:hypothetical protein RchiOBHm_Chr7g0225571 [Rosa chinensis]|uniref:Uncharacterized protein n=1 Tax=Rosa chinensis TaxID=74649 RepID=A0A2P6PE56_ROSCH|nr:hypothetical protein RchiOBHm_Chr7g0225571 [Rosa chinensis]